MSESLALKVCREEVCKAGAVSPVAKKIGYARSSVSLYLSGKYPAKDSSKLETKILTTFTDNIFCPFAEKIISKQKCEETNRKGTNTSNPMLFKLHQFCLKCPVKYNPKKEFMKQFKENNDEQS
ncbi:MAG: hypothetical protein OSJ76_05870 [Alphaproteobacteria bacterium]|nr:hypothetical protein [Alphaproteobacteria bacterium]